MFSRVVHTLFLVALWLLTLSCKKSKPKLTIKAPSKSNTWVFVLAGQSNMSGSGNAPIEEIDRFTHPRIITYTQANRIEKAKAPLHYIGNESGLDCGISFARELMKHIPDSVNILLLPCAVGGSSISQWIGDSTHLGVKLLSNMKRMIQVGDSLGEIKAILWHQGENDATEDLIPFYTSRLTILTNLFRTIAANPNLPILMGELGSYSDHPNEWHAINQSIYDYAKTDYWCKIVPTNDLQCLPDKIHFNSAGQRTLGMRYAQLYIDQFYKK